MIAIFLKVCITQKYYQREYFLEIYPNNLEVSSKQDKGELRLEAAAVLFYILSLLLHCVLYKIGVIDVKTQTDQSSKVLVDDFKKMVQVSETLFSFKPELNTKILAGMFLDKLDSEEEPPLCLLCITNNPDIVIYKNCNHGGICKECFDKVKAKKKCPFCRNVRFWAKYFRFWTKLSITSTKERGNIRF